MSETTETTIDPNEQTLKAMQEERNSLAAKIREMASERSDWDEERDQNWQKLNKDYDDVMGRIDDEIQTQKRAKETEERLAEIEHHDKQERGGRRVGVDHKEREEADPSNKRDRIERRKALYLQASVLSTVGIHHRINQQHKDAARALGVPFRKNFDIPLQQRSFAPVWIGSEREARRELLMTNGVQHRDLAVSSEPEVIPEGFSNELEVALQAFGGPRRVCRIVRTASGNDLPWPVMDDTGNSAAILAEATTIGTSVDPTVTVVTFNAYKYTSKLILVSVELIEDSAFNLAVELGRALGTRIGRGTSAHFTTGTGSSQPRGLITAALADGTTVSAASATAIAADEIIDLAHSVDPDYRMDGGNVGFMMHDTHVATVRKLKGSDNNYLWQSGLQAGVPDLLYNYPVTVNQHMDAAPAAAAEESILFGNYSRYIIRDAGMVRARVLEELYAGTDQVGFITLSRHDGDAINGAAFAVLQH